MANKNNILDFVTNVHKKGQGIPNRRPMHPRRDWFIGLCLFVAVTAVGAGMSMHFFEKYKSVDQRTYTVEVNVPEYNRTLAKTVLAYFDERKWVYAMQAGEIETAIILATQLEVASSTAASATTTGALLDEATTTPTIAD